MHTNGSITRWEIIVNVNRVNVPVTVEIDRDELTRMAKRAYASKGKKCKIGAVTVKAPKILKAGVL